MADPNPDADLASLRGCVAYRQSLDEQLPGAPVHEAEFETL
jgi:hypothetical protein